ncbi:MAG: hypothetical protein ACPG9K_01025 [Poseidonibacter sp.]
MDKILIILFLSLSLYAKNYVISYDKNIEIKKLCIDGYVFYVYTRNIKSSSIVQAFQISRTVYYDTTAKPIKCRRK